MDFESTITVLLTLAVWSYFWKSNIVYKIAVGIYSGTSIAYLAIEGLQNIYFKNIEPLGQGDYIQILPLVFSAMFLFGYIFRKYSFIGRYPSAINVAMNMGSTAAGAVIAQMYKQIIRPVTDINSAIVFIIIVVIIIYFTSTFKILDSGVLRNISKIGRYILLLAFGFTFGGGLLSGFGAILERIQYIFWTWLGVGG